jgi:hypothetical protein
VQLAKDTRSSAIEKAKKKKKKKKKTKCQKKIESRLNFDVRPNLDPPNTALVHVKSNSMFLGIRQISLFRVDGVLMRPMDDALF